MRFDLLREPWLPVITLQGEAAYVGLEDALNRAHEYRWLQGETPTVTAALHRLLLALVLRVHFDGLDSVSSDKRWSELWFSGSLPAGLLARYLDGDGDTPGYRDRFDLFGAHPFFQNTRIPEDMTGSTAKLTMFRAAGNNATLFDHTANDTRTDLSPAEAARWLVTVQAFDTGGLKAGKRPSRPSLGNGFATVVIEGADLRETLLLNVPRANPSGKPQSSSRDRPTWERESDVIQDSSKTEKFIRTPSGQMDLLTWQSRHIRLRGHEDATGVVVHDAVILPGHRMGIDLELIEHTAAFRRSFRIRKGARDKEASGPWKPIQLEEVRGVWRHCRELLIANEVDNSQYEYLRPRNLDRITELHESEGCFPEDKVFTLRVLGQQLDPNRGAVHTWLEETLPAPLSILQENPGKTSLEPFIGLAVSLAVNMGEALQRMERDYHTRLKGNSQAERRLLQQWFWHPLSEEFNRYLMALAKGIKEDPRGIAPLTASWANEVDRIAHEAHLRWVDNIPRRPADDLFSLAKCSIQFKRRTRDIRHDFNSSIETDHILLKQKNFQRISTPASIEVLQNRKIFIDGLYQLGIELDSGEPTRASRARRVLSRIRRSTNDPRYLPDLVELVLPHSPVPDEKEVWYFVAVLFSLNPRPALSGKRRPLGIAMRDSGTGSSVEARLRQLLTSDWNVLQYRLRQVVPMLQQQGVALDYGQLLDDLVELHQAPHGSARAHRVHLRWTEHFLSGWEDHHSTISAP